MKITLEDIGITFYQRKLIKNLNFVFDTQGVYALTGSNGSGKSTLAKLLAGMSKPSQGKLSYQLAGRNLEIEQLPKHLSWVGPYINLYEELDACEAFRFQRNFKHTTLSEAVFLEKTQLSAHRNKKIKYYSSGMKQRLKLGLALFFDCDLLLLDEPTINLDRNFQNWYIDHLKELVDSKGTTIIIASNVPEEYKLAQEVLNMENYR